LDWIDERFSLADNLSREIIKKEDGQFQPSLPVNLRCVSLVHVVKQSKKKKGEERKSKEDRAPTQCNIQWFFFHPDPHASNAEFRFLDDQRERGKLRENA
jgi:hypothetical protein